MDIQTDSGYMAQAFDLAEGGRGMVSPNPLVGAIIVRDGEIVGRGFHRRAGSEHAEVHALREAGSRANGATLYVTLEPCCHHGKTPPCTDAIIKSGIARVVAALPDPNPLVCGQGVACLNGAGIEVTVGLMESRARKQNEVFLKYIQTGMPFVTLKLAATLDGRIAAADGTSRWITGADARKEVHRMRAWSDAVMVGAGTVLADNPSLTVRDAGGDDPLRIIVDGNAATPPDAAAVAGHTVICALDTIDPSRQDAYEKRHAQVWTFPGVDGRLSLKALLARLGERKVTSVLCEGGAGLASSLIRERLVDKLVYMVAPKLLGSGPSAFGDIGVETIAGALGFHELTCERVGNDLVMTGYPVYTETKSR